MSSCAVLTLIVAIRMLLNWILLLDFLLFLLLLLLLLMLLLMLFLLLLLLLFAVMFRVLVPDVVENGDKPSLPVAHFSTSAWPVTEGRVPCLPVRRTMRHGILH